MKGDNAPVLEGNGLIGITHTLVKEKRIVERIVVKVEEAMTVDPAKTEPAVKPVRIRIVGIRTIIREINPGLRGNAADIRHQSLLRLAPREINRVLRHVVADLPGADELLVRWTQPLINFRVMRNSIRRCGTTRKK